MMAITACGRRGSRGGAANWRSTAAFLGPRSLATPMGFLAIEAGWMVTELGRQPWIIHGVMRTADAVTPMPGLIVPLHVLHAALLRARGGRGRGSCTGRSSKSPTAEDWQRIYRRCCAMPESRLRCSSPESWWWRSPRTCVMAGADFGGGVWDLFATGPRARRAARADRRRDRADLGSEPRVADPGRGAAVRVLPGGVRAARRWRCTSR